MSLLRGGNEVLVLHSYLDQFSKYKDYYTL